MSISRAIMARHAGDEAGADREIGKTFLKMAVQSLIFCPKCGVILDVSRAVHEDKSNTTMCGTCWDEVFPSLPDHLRAQAKVYDGRVLHKRQGPSRTHAGRKRKAEPFTGTAENEVTHERVKVSVTEAHVRAVLDEEESATCSGPCECPVEPDGTCSKFWPSRLRAVGVI